MSLPDTILLFPKNPKPAVQISTDPMRLAWRQGKPAPETTISALGAAVVHEDTAYFSYARDVHSYIIPEDKWSKLKPCSYGYFSMAVVNHKLTSIGGWDDSSATNTLLCLSSSVLPKWKKLLPPMPTKRVRPAAVTTPTHLVVAGGRTHKLMTSPCHGLSTVEVLNLHTLQWALASRSPEALKYPSVTLCGEHVYLSGNEVMFSCSVEELVKSCKPAATHRHAGDSVWTRLPDIPTYYHTLATLRGRVLTIGGRDGDTTTGAIHCYNRSTNSWSAIGEMPTPRHFTLVAVLPSNELVVVGGFKGPRSPCSITEIAHT